MMSPTTASTAAAVLVAATIERKVESPRPSTGAVENEKELSTMESNEKQIDSENHAENDDDDDGPATSRKSTNDDIPNTHPKSVTLQSKRDDDYVLKTTEDSAATNDGTSHSSSKKSKADSFLSMMTFASSSNKRSLGGCDCDECFGPRLPKDIAEAVRQYKRAKLAPYPNGPSLSLEQMQQERTLVARENSSSLSVWKLLLPAPPTKSNGDDIDGGQSTLIEYGNSYRIVHVRRLSKGSSIQSIGRGILGSSDETKDRLTLPWKEGSSYFIRPNGGKALGFIHARRRSRCVGVDSPGNRTEEESCARERGEGDENNVIDMAEEEIGGAELITFKMSAPSPPPSSSSYSVGPGKNGATMGTIEEEASLWASTIKSLFRALTAQRRPNATVTATSLSSSTSETLSSTEEERCGTVLEVESCQVVKDVVSELLLLGGGGNLGGEITATTTG